MIVDVSLSETRQKTLEVPLRICIWLICTDPKDPNKPTVLRRWDSWPCVPRIGEKYRWHTAEEDFYLDEPNIGRVVDVIHEPVRRSLFERLIGKPNKVIMVIFHVSDQRVLEEVLKQDPRWVRKGPLVDFD